MVGVGKMGKHKNNNSYSVPWPVCVCVWGGGRKKVVPAISVYTFRGGGKGDVSRVQEWTYQGINVMLYCTNFKEMAPANSLAYLQTLEELDADEREELLQGIAPTPIIK